MTAMVHRSKTLPRIVPAQEQGIATKEMADDRALPSLGHAVRPSSHAGCCTASPIRPEVA
jgi:hypothetical protein